MKTTLTREFIAEAIDETLHDPKSRALYELCFLHRQHFQDDIVADKMRLIARLYAERGMAIQGFSPEAAAHRLGRSGIDRLFSTLATAEQLDSAVLLETHKRVMDVFSGLNEDDARSLASKYLHYHFPELFFIQDARVENAAYQLGEGACGFLALAEFDPGYGRFYACCRKLVEHLLPVAGRRLTPRELDQVLRAWLERREAGIVMPTTRAEVA